MGCEIDSIFTESSNMALSTMRSELDQRAGSRGVNIGLGVRDWGGRTLTFDTC